MIENYNKYQFTVIEWSKYIIQGGGVAIILGFVFYQSLIGIMLLSPLIYPYCIRVRKRLIEKRKWQLNLEFMDAIISLSAALNAGYSAEHGFDEVLQDMSLLYNKDDLIMKELTYILNQIKMNISVEKALTAFGDRTGVEDISSFADVFTTAKRTGGDLIQVIRTSSNAIRDRIEVRREITTLITAKKFEANIMRLIPLGFILFLLISSPGFLDHLYHNIFGAILMTILLGLYLGTYLLIERIISIEM